MGLSDSALLDLFAREGDEPAFRLLVDRHLDHVHSVARRVTGNDDLARDVAQSTFLRLAERAAMIPRDLPLPAWLHQTCRSYAVNLVRAENRRKQREMRVARDLTMNAPPEAVWSQLAPVIDELVERLPAAYRDIILYRFYHNHSHAAVAEKLGLTEEAARKRAARALEKLRALLGRKGITTTTVALASLLPAHAATPAPAALAGAVALAAKGVVPIAKGGMFSWLFKATAGQKAGVAGLALALTATAATLSLTDSGSVVGSTVASVPAESESAVPTRPKRQPRVEAVALNSAEAREARLREILGSGDVLTRKEQLLGFLDGLPPEHFEEVAGKFQQIAAGLGSRVNLSAEFSLLLLTWANLDRPAAMAFIDGHAPAACEELAAWWSARDPEAALKWAEESSADSNLRLAGVLEGIARTDLLRAITLAEEHPVAMRDDLLKRVLYSLLERDRKALGRMLALVDDSALRETLIGATANYGSLSAPDGSLQLVVDHPASAAEADPLSIYNSWALRDLEAATSSLESLPRGEFRSAALSVVARETALRNPAEAFSLIGKYPGELDDAALRPVIDVSLLSDPELAMEQIAQIRDEGARSSAYVASLRSWSDRDEAAVRRWLERHPLAEPLSRKLSLR